jgi:polysaccharide chain length determinant protein (PEP-CTERM system associated)
MLPGKTYTPDEIKSILWRGRWWILLPFAVGLALAPVIASYVPELYRSETVLMVIPQRIPDSYVRSTVTASVQDRLFSISDQILSRSRLERIITEFDLYPSERRASPMEDVVATMRDRDIELQPPGREQSFRVSFTSTDPATAQKVAARLASMFIDENTREREKLAESTSVFLESQLKDAKARLLEHENRLEEYRLRNSGELPSQMTANIQAIQNNRMQMQSVNEAMNRARERRLLVERQLAELTPPPSATGEADDDATSSTGLLSLPSERPLAEAMARLKEFQLKYNPTHPDVRALERTIQDLEERVKQEALLPPPPRDTRVTPEDLAREKTIRDLRFQLDDIDRQLKGHEDQAARLDAGLEMYQTRIEAVPTRESELVELTRDYNTLQEIYSSLLEKQEDSKLAANLERRQIGEQFRMLDPASLPERPYNQRQRLIAMFSAAAGGLALGFVLVVLLELRDSSFRLESDVLRTLNLPVLALVPVMASERAVRARRLRSVIVNLTGTAAVIGSVVFVVLWGLQL